MGEGKKHHKERKGLGWGKDIRLGGGFRSIWENKKGRTGTRGGIIS